MKYRLVGIIFLLGILCSPCQAEYRTVSVYVKSVMQPEKAVGLIFSSAGALQVKASEVTSTGSGTLVVTFPYDDEQIAPDAMASAIVISPEGDTAYGLIKPLVSNSLKDSYFSLPVCEEDEPSMSLHSELSLIKKLVKVRTKMRLNRHTQIKQMLSKEKLSKLRGIEEGFGLPHTTELTADVDPAELVDRFTRIYSAIRNYRLEKEKRIKAFREQ